MNKLRNLGIKIWYNKERIVLVVLIGVLCLNVYRLLNPPKEPPEKRHTHPRGGPVELDPLDMPEPPKIPPLKSWNSIYTPSPFWYQTSGDGDSQSKDNPAADIKLLKIAKVRDKYRAQIQTRSLKGWYNEGDPFESYELISIDPDNGTCEVRSEGAGGVITLTLPGK
ncbi:MAG: hypothetical protein GWP08_20085 [Nitrospiraceae bacterium]|nr:hypothetical protein [Nitrospiraceae bacterium]